MWCGTVFTFTMSTFLAAPWWSSPRRTRSRKPCWKGAAARVHPGTGAAESMRGGRQAHDLNFSDSDEDDNDSRRKKDDADKPVAANPNLQPLHNTLLIMLDCANPAYLSVTVRSFESRRAPHARQSSRLEALPPAGPLSVWWPWEPRRRPLDLVGQPGRRRRRATRT